MLQQIDAVDKNCTRARLQHTQNYVDSGRLSGAVRTDESDYFAELDRERDRVYGDRFTVRFAEVGDSKNIPHPLMISGHASSVERWVHLLYSTSVNISR